MPTTEIAAMEVPEGFFDESVGEMTSACLDGQVYNKSPKEKGEWMVDRRTIYHNDWEQATDADYDAFHASIPGILEEAVKAWNSHDDTPEFAKTLVGLWNKHPDYQVYETIRLARAMMKIHMAPEWLADLMEEYEVQDIRDTLSFFSNYFFHNIITSDDNALNPTWWIFDEGHGVRSAIRAYHDESLKTKSRKLPEPILITKDAFNVKQANNKFREQRARDEESAYAESRNRMNSNRDDRSSSNGSHRGRNDDRRR